MNETEYQNLFREAKTIAVVGLSNDPARASNGVASYLQRQGYRIIPVNPKETEVLGEKAYASLLDVPDKIDVVDIFRRSEAVPEIVTDAIAKGTRWIWMQEGVEDELSAGKAEEAGIGVVMDRCMLKEHRHFLKSS